MSALADDAPRGFVSMREYLRLQRRCDELEDRVARHQSSSVKDTALLFVEAFTISPQRARLLACLADARLHGHETLMDASGCGSEVVLKTQICHLRAAINAHGAPQGAILNAWSIGYQMSQEARRWLRGRVPEAFKDKQQGASQ